MCLYSQRVAESRLLLAVCPVVFCTAASSYQLIRGVGGGLSSLPRAGEWGLASGRTKGTLPSTRRECVWAESGNGVPLPEQVRPCLQRAPLGGLHAERGRALRGRG